MDNVSLVLIAVGLAMDALAVSISAGVSIKDNHLRHGLVIALYFGAFQAIMPIGGWLLGSSFAQLVNNIQHWISFVILCGIGIKMLKDVKQGCETSKSNYTCHKTLLLLAIATSIDAFVIGISFSLVSISILIPVLMIGVITFIISLAGVFAGKLTGCWLKSYAEYAGGIILIFIGVKTLLKGLLQ